MEYETTPLHVDVNIVSNDILDVEAFKAWSAFAQKVAEESGFEVVPQRNSTGGEDFAFYLEKIPGCFINVGTGGGYPNHHPKFYADEAALTPAAEYLEKLLVEALRQ